MKRRRQKIHYMPSPCLVATLKDDEHGKIAEKDSSSARNIRKDVLEYFPFHEMR